MDSETIYEALGEVVPIEKKNGSKVSIDEGFGAHPDEENLSSMQQPLFSHEMTDEAVAECIFDCCDMEKTGLVRVSVLVEFLLKYAAENSEIRETFQQVLIALDPSETNPEVTIEIFQSALKLCISKLTSKAEDSEWLLGFSSLKLQSTVNSITPNNNNESVSCNSTSASELLCGMMDIKELQYQFNRLQEENILLQEQMADVEESNVSLRSENSQLKSRINKVELTASEIGQHSKVLQEDNGQLQGRVTQMKDDLQKMTVHYDECRRELEKKVCELESLQVNRMKGEEHCQHLIDTIRQLEEIILAKEEELLAKDKEIQRIAQDLMEQHLSDQVVVNEFGNRQGSEVTENLAAELQSSFGDTPWKKQMIGSVSKPDFIHPAAWNVMLNEPEYEDEPISITTSISNAESTSSGVEHDKAIRNADQVHNQVTRNSFGSLSTQISQCQRDDMVHSTPISKTAPNSRFCNEEQAITESSSVLGFFKFLRHLLGVFFFTLMLTVVFAIASVAALLLLLSMSSASGCSGVSNYHQQASPFYSSSLWYKVFEIIKPYCSIEYHSCPPV